MTAGKTALTKKELAMPLSKRNIQTTFTSDGTGSAASAAFNMKLSKEGKMLALYLPQVYDVTAGTGATKFTSSVTLPVWARPHATVSFPVKIKEHGTVNTVVGILEISTAGVISLYTDTLGGAWTTSATATSGLDATCVTYVCK